MENPESTRIAVQNTASGNKAEEGSFPFTIRKEFPAHANHEGSPFVWLEEPGKKTAVGGVDALKEYAIKTFPDNAAIQRWALVNPTGMGAVNMFGNATPGYTIPDPLP